MFDDLHEIMRRHFRDLHTMTLLKLEEQRLRAYEEQRKQINISQRNHPYNQIPLYAQYNMSYQTY